MFTVLATRERTGLEHCPLELQNVDPHFSDTTALAQCDSSEMGREKRAPPRVNRESAAGAPRPFGPARRQM